MRTEATAWWTRQLPGGPGNCLGECYWIRTSYLRNMNVTLPVAQRGTGQVGPFVLKKIKNLLVGITGFEPVTFAM